MRLLPAAAFEPVFAPLVGRRVGLAPLSGNLGDLLIERATVQLLELFGIAWCRFDPGRPAAVDEILYGGGGNMGARYPRCRAIRERCLATGLPVTVLPQSFHGREDRPYHRVYVRERASLALAPPGALLAPDLALGLDLSVDQPVCRELGVFLRRDRESVQRLAWLARDPVRLCDTPEAYLRLAARHGRLITDRLHFAIAGLLAGRWVVLLANDYHKNRSMHATWLADLGCGFAERVREARRYPGP